MLKANLPTGAQEVIALAGAGDLGRYVCEEFLRCSDFVPIILSRGVGLLTLFIYQTTCIRPRPIVKPSRALETDASTT